MEVRTAPTSTTNITGFLIIVRGCNLRNESIAAALKIFGSVRALVLDCNAWSMSSLERLSREHHQMLENGAETQSREKGQCSHNHDRGNKQNSEKGAGYRERAKRCRSRLLSYQIPADRHDGDTSKDTAHHHTNRPPSVAPH